MINIYQKQPVANGVVFENLFFSLQFYFQLSLTGTAGLKHKTVLGLKKSFVQLQISFSSINRLSLNLLKAEVLDELFFA